MNGKPPVYYGHRGVPSSHFENSLNSFVAAGEEKSYSGIETDVWLTLDNCFVVVHDEKPFVETDKGIPELTLSQARTYTLHASINYPLFVEGIYHIPTFEEYLQTCKTYGKKAVIEVKHPHLTKEQLQYLVDIVKKEGMRDEALFISFNDDEVNILREIAPEFFTAQLVDGSEGTTNQTAEWYLDHNIPVNVGDKESNFSWLWGTDITLDLIKKSYDKGLPFGVWGTDTKQRAEELIKMGVDYITTDYVEADGPSDLPRNQDDGKYLIDKQNHKKDGPKT